MNHERMKEIVELHIAAEVAGDSETAISVYTDDVEHELIGAPTGKLHGPAAAKGFYDQLISDLDTEAMIVTREQYGDDFCVVEHDATCVVKGSFMGIPGENRRVTFKMLHVWDFKNDKVSREQIWLDGASIAAQLSAPAQGDVPTELAPA